MKLVVDCLAFASYAHFVWCVLAVNEILSSEEALRAWMYPAVQCLSGHFGVSMGFPTFLDIVMSISSIPVQVYVGPGCGISCMVVNPVENLSRSNSVARPEKIGIASRYFYEIQTQRQEFVANARFHVLVMLLHECATLMTPHILRALNVTTTSIPKGAGEHFLSAAANPETPKDERIGDFGYLWEESLFGGVLSAPEPLFQALYVARIKDCTRSSAADNPPNERWVIPPAHCAHVLREIDRWANPTGLGRVCQWFRRPCPVAVFDFFMHTSRLPPAPRGDADSLNKPQAAPSVCDEGADEPHDAAMTSVSPSLPPRSRHLRADPTTPPPEPGPQKFFKSAIGLYYTTRRDIRV